jgi:uncharacterized membrane protein (DUF485 family)
VSWLLWRQYRASTAITGALVGAFAVLVVITGVQIAHQFHNAFGACLAANTCRFPSDQAPLGNALIGAIVEFSLAVPAILGMFLGAPAVAREVETGTAHFAWTQAITRRHWLTVKTGWLLLAAVAWGGAVGALVTWWSGPRNTAELSQFNPGTFDVQGIMPAVYSVFAMALGIAAGTLIRRVLPALGVTLGVFFAVRLMIMGWVRQHYMTPVTSIYNIAANVLPPKGAAWILGQGIRGPNGPLTLPAGPIETVGSGAGFPVADIPAACHAYFTHGSAGRQLFPCLTSHGYSQYVTYQPAARYWPFQFIEAGIFVVLAAALIAVAFAVINRRDA